MVQKSVKNNQNPSKHDGFGLRIIQIWESFSNARSKKTAPAGILKSNLS